MRNNFQKGFTFLEMVIVIAIFLLITGVVFSIYFFNSKVYIAGESIAEITQNGRVILERITREIRQAKEIVTDLPEEELDPANEILFQDGHLSIISEQATAQGGTSQTITLSSSSSSTDDYYKDVFIKITQGTGAGQIRKVISYDGATKEAEIDEDWETIPDITSEYKIDTNYYYIHYYVENSNILREVVTYCYSDDGVNCQSPEMYVPWNTSPTPVEVVLESPRIVGEYISNIEFWGSSVINIFLTLQTQDKSINLRTKIFGRNL